MYISCKLQLKLRMLNNIFAMTGCFSNYINYPNSSPAFHVYNLATQIIKIIHIQYTAVKAVHHVRQCEILMSIGTACYMDKWPHHAICSYVINSCKDSYILSHTWFHLCTDLPHRNTPMLDSFMHCTIKRHQQITEMNICPLICPLMACRKH